LTENKNKNGVLYFLNPNKKFRSDSFGLTARFLDILPKEEVGKIFNNQYMENKNSLAHLEFHKPVLLNEVVSLLAPQANERLIDATVGTGGHLLALFEKTAGRLKALAIDKNSRSLKLAQLRLSRFAKNIVFVREDFANLKTVARRAGFLEVEMILFDLGVASWQFQDENLGLSFAKDAPLDMRLSEKGSKTAFVVVNNYNRADLERVIREYGEEKEYKKIADFIIRARPIYSTKELADVVTKAKKETFPKKIHPATKVFQAIRIEVNEELSALEEGVKAALEILATGGRLAVISYHSLEDRIVKRLFLTKKREGGFLLLTKKPLQPTPQEVYINPSSRSAKLRVIKKLT